MANRATTQQIVLPKGGKAQRVDDVQVDGLVSVEEGVRSGLFTFGCGGPECWLSAARWHGVALLGNPIKVTLSTLLVQWPVVQASVPLEGRRGGSQVLEGAEKACSART